MQARTSNSKTIRRIALFTTVAVGAALVSASTATAKPPPSPNPTDSRLARATSAKAALAFHVGRLSARIVVIQGQMRKLESGAQLAEQKLALALQRQQQAKDVAVAANANVTEARDRVDQAQRDFVSYVQASYMTGHVAGTTGALLTATDPSVLLEQGTLRDYESRHQLDAIENLQRATVRMSNADAAGRGALAKQTQIAHEAQLAQQNVLSALAVAKSQRTALNTQLAVQQKSLIAAQIKLTGL
ncbi:MAG: hypothetical protein JWO57_20, partial [Pseudonocardiales bacterium]|nr:hypothetical protein [Pseudonocardiales bacterium]